MLPLMRIARKRVPSGADVEKGADNNAAAKRFVAKQRLGRFWAQLDTWFPLLNRFRCLLFPLLAIFLAYHLVIITGYFYKATRTARFNAIMPPEFAVANLVPAVLWDTVVGCVVWCLYATTVVVLMSLAFSLFGALPTTAPVEPARRCWRARFGNCCKVLVWMVIFNWFFTQGFIAGVGDLNMNAHGGMFWYVNWPFKNWAAQERLKRPADLDQLCASPGACRQTIEKVIHQTYKTEALPAAWKDTPQRWKDLHPGWEYKFWTDRSSREFIADSYPWFLETFDNYQYPIQRADAIRYFALYHYGGVYADLDLEPRQNLERLFSGPDVVAFETPNMGLTNMIMGAKKGSHFMRCVLAQLPVLRRSVQSEFVHLKGWRILSSTGPTFWWAMAMPGMCGKVFGDNGNAERLRIVSADFMGRCSLCDGDVSKCTKVGVLKHLVGSSWHGRTTSGVHFLFCQPAVVWAAIAIVARVLQALWKKRRGRPHRVSLLLPKSTPGDEAIEVGLLAATAVLFSVLHSHSTLLYV